MSLDRTAILERLAARLEPLPSVLAFWEGGSAAFGLEDELSDIDLMAIVEDGAVPALFAEAEAALESLAPIELVWRVADPGFPGLVQRFYRLAGAPPTLLVDLGVLERRHEQRFLEPEQHGHARVLFDKASLTTPPPFDEHAFRARMKRDLAEARAKFEMLETLAPKELQRGNFLDALAYYLALTMRPLVLVLGMRHRPLRYDFGPRYVARDCGPALAAELADLYAVRDADDLAAKIPRAQALFRATVAALDLDALPLAALSARARARVGP